MFEENEKDKIETFLFGELSGSIIETIERAAIVGLGKAESFIPVLVDIQAQNLYADVCNPKEGELAIESISRAVEMLQSDGPVYLIAKKGYMKKVKSEKDASGEALFPMGVSIQDIIKGQGINLVMPGWFTDKTCRDYDAIVVVGGAYKLVGDMEVEFDNVNNYQYSLRMWQGGGLGEKKSAIGITKSVEA